MKNPDTHKNSEKFSELLQRTSDFGKKAVTDVKEGALTLSERTGEFGRRTVANIQNSAHQLSEKSKHDSYLRRLKKYNPVFPDVYKSQSFNIPNIILIVDDAVRRGIDVCEGAIGWLDTKGGTEILCLYDEAVEFSGLRFVPVASCDSLYYVDNFDRNTFIRIDCVFSKAHDDKIAELEHVAHALGARSCSVELSETHKESSVAKRKSSTKVNSGAGPSASEEFEMDSRSSKDLRRSGKTVAHFKGSDNPEMPTLKWFAHNETILKLIDYRFSGDNSISSKELHIYGSSAATMSRKAAAAIDAAASAVHVKGSMSMEDQVHKEEQTTLIYHVEF